MDMNILNAKREALINLLGTAACDLPDFIFFPIQEFVEMELEELHELFNEKIEEDAKNILTNGIVDRIGGVYFLTDNAIPYTITSYEPTRNGEMEIRFKDIKGEENDIVVTVGIRVEG